ncbi:MAG: LTA synthase family protein [Oligoflexia bacterium]|nr:LTA synthase family protein [Oligoflexia bacterium]
MKNLRLPLPPRLTVALRFLAPLAPGAALFVALTLLRASIITQVHREGAVLTGVALATGLLEDLALVVLCLGGGRLAGLLPLPATGARAAIRAATILFMVIGWISTLANTLYFGYFNSRLDAWIVKTHVSDLSQIGESTATISAQVEVFLSVAFFLAALVLLFLTTGRRPAIPSLARRTLRNAALATGLVIAGLLLKQSPVWFHGLASDPAGGGFKGGITNEQIVFVWWDQVVGRPEQPADEFLSFERARELRAQLRKLRDFTDEEPRAPSTAKARLTSASSGNPALGTAAAPDAAAALDTAIALDTAAAAGGPGAALSLSAEQLRARLGLPATGPIHILMLFLESTRAFEFNHPTLSPLAVPESKRLIAEHGLYFEQAYSSSLEPGQTARGIFSTLCGTLPHIGGPAVYIGYSHLRAECLPDALKNAGYDTMSIQPFKKNYHNAMTFESLHGIRYFYDMDDIIQRSPSGAVKDWGVDERTYFDVAFDIVSAHVATGKPVFAHFRTNSTHHPFFIRPEATLPEALPFPLTDDEYRKYLGAIRTADLNTTGFIRRVFESSFGERTLVVLLADHSLQRDTGAVPGITDYQYRELKGRIPIALLTRKMVSPGSHVTYPVHQLDVAPTVATLARVPMPASWLGRGLLSGEGRPWLFRDDQGVSYRTRSTVCYASLRKKGAPTCFAIPPGKDPLLDTGLAETAENPAITRFFDELLTANRRLIRRNQLVEQ